MADDEVRKFTMPNLARAMSPPDALFDTSHLQELSDSVARAAGERVTREKKIAAAAEHSLKAAAVAVESLIEAIAEYERTLGDHEEIAIYVIGGPAGQEFFPRIIKPLNPDKVLYGGTDPDGRPFTVIQHVTQLNFAMMAKFVEGDEKARRVIVGVPEEGADE